MGHTRTRRRTVGRGVAIAALLALPVAGCGGDDDTGAAVDGANASDSGASASGASDSDEPAGDQPASGLVTPSEAAALAADETIVIVDVRTPEEFASGHLAGATEIDFRADDFADRIGQLDRNGRYLVYCHSGNRSGQATAMMRELGFDQVYDLDGGVEAWSAAGLPLVR